MRNEKTVSISKPQVMESAAGYYIGTDCEIEVYDEKGKVEYTYPCPYDRYSGYFSTAKEAEAVLVHYKEIMEI